MVKFTAASLIDFVASVFAARGIPEARATTAARVLILADLRGISSHGIARLPGYLRLMDAGRINPKAQPKILHQTLSTARVDADGGLGLWTGTHGMEIAIEKAQACGSGWVAMQNSSHFGIAVGHAAWAVHKGCIGLAMTNASPLVVPAGAAEPYLGTNPICVTIPAGKYKYWMLDMATSAAANGKLEIAERQGKPIPEGWATDAQGKPTTNAAALKEGGSLLPLGSTPDLGSHKGSGLGGLVDILSGVLSGANFGMWVPPFPAFLQPKNDLPGQGIGHFFGAWQIDAFMEQTQFIARMEQWIDGLKGLKKAEGIDEILFPGEAEPRLVHQQMAEGIELEDALIKILQQTSSAEGIKMPDDIRA